MQVVIRGRRLPGRQCGPYTDVHVGLQVGSRPDALVPADVDAAEWTTEVHVTSAEGERDFRGAAVHGRRGERFLYLSWGELDGEQFAMFRRAKLMLADAPDGVDRVVADVELTDGEGMPCCARLHEPMIRWTAG